MITQDEIVKIKELVGRLLQKMTLDVLNIEVREDINEQNKDTQLSQPSDDIVAVGIKISDPQIAIGQNGQTLFELQRILKILLNKELGKHFYLALDINDYKKNKTEYLKKMAQEMANEVVITKKSKALPPMNSYERLIIHKELSQRQDIKTKSQGDEGERRVLIEPHA